MRSTRAAGVLASFVLSLCALVALAFAPAGLAAGSGTIAEAHPLAVGVPFHGTTAHTALDEGSATDNDFSTLTLQEGDYLTVDWKGGKNTLDLLAPGTTDETPLLSVKPIFSLDGIAFTAARNVFQLSQRYLVKTSGTYLFRAWTDSTTVGPYTLTVYVQRGAKGATCPMPVQVSFAAGHVTTVRIVQGEIEAHSPVGLGIFVSLSRRQANGAYKRVPMTFGQTTPAGPGKWASNAHSVSPLPAGRYQWIVSPQSVVRDERGYFCIPAIVVKKFTVG